MAELLYFLLLKQKLCGIFLPEQTIQWNFQTSHQEGQSVGGSCSEKRSVSFYLTRFPFPKKTVQISQFWGKENSYYPQTYGSFIFARQPQIPSCFTSHKEMVPLCMLLPNPVRVVCVYVCVRACICKLLFPIKFGWVRKLFFSCHFRLQISRVK